VLINKSITIDCGGQLAGDSSSPFVFKIDAPGALVRLRNLSMNGVNGFGATGIDFVNGAALFVENCTIVGFRISPAIGIKFTPGASATLAVTDSFVGSNTTGILLDPDAGGNTFAVIQRVTLQGNTSAGLAATGSGGGGLHVSVRNSISSLNGSHGFTAVTNAGGSGVVMKIDGSEASLNGGFGVFVNGLTSVAIGHSTVMGNGTGLGQFNGGQIFSYGNNVIFDNGVDGAPSAVIPLK